MVRLGQVSLGIYVTHLFFIRALTPLFGNTTLPQAALLAFASLTLSTILSLMMSRIRALRWLVS